MEVWRVVAVFVFSSENLRTNVPLLELTADPNHSLGGLPLDQRKPYLPGGETTGLVLIARLIIQLIS